MMLWSPKWMWSILVILSFGSDAFSQDSFSSIRGPMLGFVQDSGGATIQPVFGIPGASLFGEPLAIGAEIRGAVISPKQNYALAVQSATGQVVRMRFDAGAFTLDTWNAAGSLVDRIAISASGTSVATLSEDKVFRSIAIDADAANFEFNFSDFSGEIRAIWIADDGKLGVVNVVADGESTLWAVNAYGRWPLPGLRPSGATFVANGHDLVIADDAAQEVFVLLNIDQDGTRLPVASFSTEFDGFTGVAASEDGRRIFIGNRKTQSVTVVDLASANSTELPCLCTLSSFSPLIGTSIFRLSDPADGAVAVLDASSDETRISFIAVKRAEGLQQ